MSCTIALNNYTTEATPGYLDSSGGQMGDAGMFNSFSAFIQSITNVPKDKAKEVLSQFQTQFYDGIENRVVAPRYTGVLTDGAIDIGFADEDGEISEDFPMIYKKRVSVGTFHLRANLSEIPKRKPKIYL